MGRKGLGMREGKGCEKSLSGAPRTLGDLVREKRRRTGFGWSSGALAPKGISGRR